MTPETAMSILATVRLLQHDWYDSIQIAGTFDDVDVKRLSAQIRSLQPLMTEATALLERHFRPPIAQITVPPVTTGTTATTPPENPAIRDGLVDIIA